VTRNKLLKNRIEDAGKDYLAFERREGRCEGRVKPELTLRRGVRKEFGSRSTARRRSGALNFEALWRDENRSVKMVHFNGALKIGKHRKMM